MARATKQIRPVDAITDLNININNLFPVWSMVRFVSATPTYMTYDEWLDDGCSSNWFLSLSTELSQDNIILYFKHYFIDLLKIFQ